MDSVINKDASDGIKGWMCICILVHHLCQFTGLFENTYFGHFINLIGRWAVALFYFLSAYGICFAFSNNRIGYRKQFFKKRFIPLYLTYVYAVLIYFVYDLKSGTGFIDILRSLTWGGTVVSFGWYFQMLFIMYLICYFALGFTDNKIIRSIICIICLAAYFIIAYSFGQQYLPVFSFAFGLVVCSLRKKLKNFLNKYCVLITVISFVILFSMYMIYIYGNIMVRIQLTPILLDVIYTVSDLSVIIFALSLNHIFDKYKVPVIVNPVTGWIKNYSLEIYIIQGLFFRLWIKYINNTVLYCLVSLVTIFIGAIALHWFVWLTKKPLIKFKVLA